MPGNEGDSSSAVALGVLSGSTLLTVGSIADGQTLQRAGTTIIGASGVAPGGAAAGDLSGTYPNPTVARVAGVTPGAGGLAILDDADAPAMRTTLGLVPGTDVQAYSATLAAVAGGTYAGDDSIVTVGTIGAGTWRGTAIERAYGGYAPVSSASDPTVNDDSGDGYAVGQVWVNTTTDVPFMLADATVGAAVWRSLLRVTGCLIQVVGGVLVAQPQAWTGSAWVNVGASTALTVETAGSFTMDGDDFVIPSGLTNSTQPHTSQFKAYIALSALSFWSATADATYRIEMGETSMGTDSDFARWGWALATAVPMDASTKVLMGGRYGRNTGSAVWTFTSAIGTGTWTSRYSNAAPAVYRHITYMSGTAQAMLYVTGGATVDVALAPATTAATHLVWIGAGSGVTTAPVTVEGGWLRISRMPGV